MNVLIVGIPNHEIIENISREIGEIKSLFLIELRPFEKMVSESLQSFDKYSFPISIICDNMMGALFQNKNINQVYAQYLKTLENSYETFSGTAICALLCREHNIPFNLINQIELPEVAGMDFFGHSVEVEGAKSANLAFDEIPKEWVSRVMQ